MRAPPVLTEIVSGLQRAIPTAVDRTSGGLTTFFQIAAEPKLIFWPIGGLYWAEDGPPVDNGEDPSKSSFVNYIIGLTWWSFFAIVVYSPISVVASMPFIQLSSNQLWTAWLLVATVLGLSFACLWVMSMMLYDLVG